MRKRSLSSLKDKLAAEATRGRVTLGVLAVMAALYPLLDRNAYHADVVTNALLFAVLALGLNVIMGYAGLLSLGYAAFYAVGAYMYGILSSNIFHPGWSDLYQPLEWLGLVSRLPGAASGADVVQLHFSFWLVLPLAGLAAAALGIAIGAPAIRLRGDYLAIVTLGFGEMVPVLIRNFQSVTGGAMGLGGVNSPSIFGYRFGLNPVPYYYLGLALLFFVVIVCYRLQSSRLGRAWRALKESEEAAVCMGVDQSRVKLLAFSIGAAFAGIAGAIAVAKLTLAAPEMFMFPVSVMLVVVVVMGGAGSIAGVVMAAVFLSLLQSLILPSLTPPIHALGALTHIGFLQNLELVKASQLLFGIILVIVILYRPQGLLPMLLRVTSLRTQDVKVEPIPGRRIALPIRPSSEPRVDGPVLQTIDLTKHFGGVHALEGLTVEVRQGDILGIIGPNGSGKTTFFNVLTGLEPPDRGKATFLGMETTGLAPHSIAHLGIARTFQTIHLFLDMSVLENVLVGQHTALKSGLVASVLRTPQMASEEREAREWGLEVLGIFGNRLLPRAHHPAASLSYANRRRLEIARALASRPKLLLLDEPTAGMNPAETAEISDQLTGLPDVGVTVIVIEHKLHVVTTICNRVIALDHGMKIAEGTSDDVRNDRRVLQAYLGQAPASSAATV